MLLIAQEAHNVPEGRNHYTEGNLVSGKRCVRGDLPPLSQDLEIVAGFYSYSLEDALLGL